MQEKGDRERENQNKTRTQILSMNFRGQLVLFQAPTRFGSYRGQVTQ
jgi:hypothetical protein